MYNQTVHSAHCPPGCCRPAATPAERNRLHKLAIKSIDDDPTIDDATGAHAGTCMFQIASEQIVNPKKNKNNGVFFFVPDLTRTT